MVPGSENPFLIADRASHRRCRVTGGRRRSPCCRVGRPDPLRAAKMGTPGLVSGPAGQPGYACLAGTKAVRTPVVSLATNLTHDDSCDYQARDDYRDYPVLARGPGRFDRGKICSKSDGMGPEGPLSIRRGSRAVPPLEVLLSGSAEPLAVTRPLVALGSSSLTEGQWLCTMVLVVWSHAMVQEVQDCFQFVMALLKLPRSRITVTVEGEGEYGLKSVGIAQFTFGLLMFCIVCQSLLCWALPALVGSATPQGSECWC